MDCSSGNHNRRCLRGFVRRCFRRFKSLIVNHSVHHLAGISEALLRHRLAKSACGSHRGSDNLRDNCCNSSSTRISHNSWRFNLHVDARQSLLFSFTFRKPKYTIAFSVMLKFAVLPCLLRGKFMAYCSTCGEKLPKDAYFCPKCGTKTSLGMESNAPTPSDEMRQAFAKM